MADWYWMKNGEKHGPVDTAHLKQLAQTGQLQPTDTIWREGLPNWVPASQANGLEFGAARGARTGTSVATAPARPSSQQPRPSRGIIKYRCVHCGGGLESEGRFAGKQDTCPMCGKATPVPLHSTAGAGAFFRKIPKAIYIGTAAVVLIAVVSLGAWLALRDTWEQDHGSELWQMSEQTISLIRDGKNEEGVAKYEAMLALVGDRQLEDSQLRQAMADARKMAETTKQTMDREREEAERKRREAENLATLRSLESQAQAFVRGDDLQSGIDKYQQALDLIRENQTDNPEFADAIGRISQAKTRAAAGLEQQRRAEEERRKREEEERRMASIRAKVHGGAWVVKKAGSSETLRGLRVYALKSRATNEQLLAMLQTVLAGNQARLESDKKSMAFNEKWAKDHPDNEYMQADYARSKRIVELRQGIIQSLKDQIASVSKRDGSEPVDMRVIYEALPQNAYSEETKTWAAICSQQMAGTVHTDVDGKYELELPGGDYYLYGSFESAYSRIEWFVPARIADAGGVKVDFHNENAALIENKND